MNNVFNNTNNPNNGRRITPENSRDKFFCDDNLNEKIHEKGILLNTSKEYFEFFSENKFDIVRIKIINQSIFKS